MGYFVLILAVLVFIYFTTKQVRRFFSEAKQVDGKITGYYLLVHTYEEKDTSSYFGVFQQGDQEITLQMPLKLYLQLTPPKRGELVAINGEVLEFT